MAYEGEMSSGRLGAAVQRVMAMRERQSARAVEGIGAMREVYRSRSEGTCKTGTSCWRCGATIESNAGYWAEAEPQMVSLPGVRAQSTRYSRFCSPCPADEGSSKTEDGNGSGSASAVLRQEMCEGCWVLQIEDAIPTVNVKKKGLFVRLVCRHLLRFHKKSYSPPVF